MGGPKLIARHDLGCWRKLFGYGVQIEVCMGQLLFSSTSITYKNGQAVFTLSIGTTAHICRSDVH